MTRFNNHRRGFALVMVTTVIGLVAVLGLAMLSSNSLVAQQTTTTTGSTSAKWLAESGVSLACYYLQYPQKAPSLGSGGYWTGGQNLSLGSSVAGVVDVGVSRVSAGVYDVTATGKAGSDPSSRTLRSVKARVQVSLGLQISCAADFTGDATIPASTTISGNLQDNGNLKNYGRVYGTAYATSVTNYSPGVLWNSAPLPQGFVSPVPTQSNLNNYTTYNYNGRTYSAVQLTGSTLASGTQLGPTPANPAGVFWASGALTLRSNVQINGTLWAKSTLNVRGSGCQITAVDGFPGLIGQGNVNFDNSAVESLTVNGVTWMSGKVQSTGVTLLASLTLNGAALFSGSGAGIDSNYSGSASINYDPLRAYAPTLDNTIPPPNVKVISWQ